MQPKYLASLEFDKILSRAAQGIVCPEARGLLLEEQPGATPQAVRDKLAETDAMTALLIKNGTPRFDRVENVKKMCIRDRTESLRTDGCFPSRSTGKMR